MTKREARRRARELVRALSDAERAKLSAVLTERFLSMPEYSAARTVMAYVSFGTEPDTYPLLRRVLADGKRLALPYITGGAMEAREIGAIDELVPGEYGIPAPKDTAPLVPTDEIELILVPGAAFDVAKRRLGRGGGFYDRFLPLTGAFRAAAAFDALVWDEVPTEPHDASVDCIVTETRIIR